MFKKLIEKIKQQDKPTCLVGFQSETQNRLNAEYNRGLNKAIDIIKASEPPELDAPDCEGWWWLLEDDDPPECFYVKSIANGIIVCDIGIKTCYEIKVSSNAKWVKAIAPKGGK